MEIEEGGHLHHQTSKDSIVVSKYISFEIINEGLFFSITSLLSLYLFYNKMIDNFMTKWQVCFYPTYLFLGVKFVKFLISILKYEESNNYIYIKVKNLENILIASNFFSLILYSEAFMAVYYFAEFMDYKSDDYLFYCVYVLMAMLVTHILYSFVRYLPIFKFETHDSSINEDHKGSTTAFTSSILTALLNYISSMLIVCNASTGTCTQIYMSTITSIFGAFGVTIADFSDYLFPVTVVLLLVSLFSLYINKRKFTHKPFLLGVISTTVIILSHFYESLWLFLYIGNIGMIAAAIWNARLNKFYGLPRFST